MNQKVTLFLNESELLELRNFINDESNSQNLNNQIQLSIERNNLEDFVKRKVFEELSSLSGFEIQDIKESQNLKDDLGLRIYHKKALKIPFQRIVWNLNSSGIITVSECASLVTVINCINLIKSKL